MARRASWLRWASPAAFSSRDGRVALVGDAAHAMTASMGMGANCALQSAARLAEAIAKKMDAEGAGGCTVDMVSEAFLEYGRARPGEVTPIQEMSAARNGLEERVKF